MQKCPSCQAFSNVIPCYKCLMAKFKQAVEWNERLKKAITEQAERIGKQNQEIERLNNGKAVT